MVHISRHSTYCINTPWYKQSSRWISFYESSLVQFAPRRMFMRTGFVKRPHVAYCSVPCSKEVPLSHKRPTPQLCQTVNEDHLRLSHPSLSNATMAWAFEASHGTTWLNETKSMKARVERRDKSGSCYGRLWPGKPIIRQQRKTLQTETNYLAQRQWSTATRLLVLTMGCNVESALFFLN